MVRQNGRAEREAQREAKTVPLKDWAAPEHDKLYVTRRELVQFFGIFDRAVERRLVERFHELHAAAEAARLPWWKRWLRVLWAPPAPAPVLPHPEAPAVELAPERVAQRAVDYAEEVARSLERPVNRREGS